MGTYKNIHIGRTIALEVEEQNINHKKIMRYFKCNSDRVISMYENPYIDTEDLLRWSTLLRKDFFRLYSGYLILHRGISFKPNTNNIDSQTRIRKNVYTLDFKNKIIEKIRLGKVTTREAITKYNIPKTTLYKWLHQF
jgi:hypothetical protein